MGEHMEPNTSNRIEPTSTGRPLLPHRGRPIHPQADDRVETLVPAPRGRGEYNHARYLATPQERQAWTQVLGLAHQLYPQAVEACRDSARKAYKKVARVLKRGVKLFR